MIRFFLDLIYPHHCLHCRQKISSSKGLFCKFCLAHLFMVDAALHCPCCFFQLRSLCTQDKCASFTSVRCAFYQSDVSLSLLESIKHNPPWTEGSVSIEHLLYALNHDLKGIDGVLIKGFPQKKIAKAFAKSLGTRICKEKALRKQKGKNIVVLTDIFHKNSQLKELASSLPSHKIHIVALIAAIEPQAEWMIKPLADPSLLDEVILSPDQRA